MNKMTFFGVPKPNGIVCVTGESGMEIETVESLF